MSTRLCLPILTAFLLTLLAGCGDTDGEQAPAPAPAPAFQDDGVIRVATLGEQIDPDVPARFERVSGRTVRVEAFDSGMELIDALSTASASAPTYDLVIVPDALLPDLIRKGLVVPVDRTRLENVSQLMPIFREQPGEVGTHSVPFQWGALGLVYRSDRLPQLEPTWDVILGPGAAPADFLLLYPPRMMLAVAIRSLDGSVAAPGDEARAAAAERVRRASQAPGFAGYASSRQAAQRVAAGEVAIGIAQSCDALRVMANDPRVGFVLPREGSILWTEVVAMPAMSRHTNAAYELMDFLLEPQVSAELASHTRCATPVEAALPHVNAEDRANPHLYPPPELMAKIEAVPPDAATQPGTVATPPAER